MSPQFVVTQTKATLDTWIVSASVGAGANASLTSDRLVSWFASGLGGGSTILEGVDEASNWQEMADRVGTIRETGASTPTTTSGSLPTDSSHFRVRNAAGAAQVIKIVGWMLV